MYQALKVMGLVVLALVVVGVLLGGGFLLGSATTSREVAIAPQPGAGYGPGMMQDQVTGPAPFDRPGITGRGGFDPRAERRGALGGMGQDGFGRGVPADVEPLTIDEVTLAVEAFLTRLGRENLALGKIIIFDNHAYAVIEDTSSGQGAFEVLVDPVRQVVRLEPGPSMMWNAVYGVHGSDPIRGAGRMAGAGEAYGPTTVTADAEPLTEAEARDKAAAYLAEAYPAQTLAGTAEAFPGYFTFEVEADGALVSMLSVHAYTGQVWYHSWHGAFVARGE